MQTNFDQNGPDSHTLIQKLNFVPLTELQQGAYDLCLNVTQLAVELPVGCSQLMEAGDEAHHILV